MEWIWKIFCIPRIIKKTSKCNLPEMGLMDYKARFYNSTLGRFVQPDTIIPGAGNPQEYNRYAYTINNPIKFNDPSGHKACSSFDSTGNCIADTEWHNRPSPTLKINTTIVTQTSIVSFSMQPIKVMETGETYSGFSGSGEPNAVIRPTWDNRRLTTMPMTRMVSSMEASYSLAENMGNASYVLFPHGNQIVTSYVRSYQTNELAYIPSPMLTDVIITNNSQNYLNYKLSIQGENINLVSLISAAPGDTETFNIFPTTIPYEGLNVSVRATNTFQNVCIASQNPILFRGWIDFRIQN